MTTKRAGQIQPSPQRQFFQKEIFLFGEKPFLEIYFLSFYTKML